MVIKRSQKVLTSDFPPRKVVFNTATRVPYILNGTGSEIWDLCDRPRSLDELVDHLFQKHGVDTKSAASDVNAFVKELKKRGLLDEVKSKM